MPNGLSSFTVTVIHIFWSIRGVDIRTRARIVSKLMVMSNDLITVRMTSSVLIKSLPTNDD